MEWYAFAHRFKFNSTLQKTICFNCPQIKTDDEITWDEILHLLPANHVATAQKAVAACGTIRGPNRCETAYLTAKCYFAAVPEVSQP